MNEKHKVSWAFEGGTKPPWCQCSNGTTANDVDDGLNLNTDLVGVRATLDVLRVYECNVGFYLHTNGNEPEDDREKDLLPDEHDQAGAGVSQRRKRWSDLVQELVQSTSGPLSPIELTFLDATNITDPSSSSSSSPSCSASTTPSTPSFSISSADSISPPSTPNSNASSSSHHNAHRSNIDSQDPTSPSTKLNASADSFIPADINLDRSAPPSPTESAFTFPSLNPLSTPVTILRKDEQGFYTEVNQQTSPHPRLPPFLIGAGTWSGRRRVPASKTRAIVDNMRLKDGAARKLDFKRLKPGPLSDAGFNSPEDEGGGGDVGKISCEDEELGDGWIRSETTIKTTKLMNTQDEKQAKAQRTRDLFLALARHRSGEVGEEENSEKEKETSGHIPAPSSSKSSLAMDGWIEFGNAALHPSPFPTTPPLPPSPLSFSPFPFPIPPIPSLYYPHPIPYQHLPHPQPNSYATAYMQMQAYMHMVTQQGVSPPPFPPHFSYPPLPSLQRAVRWS